MVEDGRLGGARPPCVVMRSDRVQKLCENVRLETAGLLFDQAQSEMNVTEEATFGSWQEEGSAVELPHAADVVEESGGEQEIGAEARMELRGVPAERRDGHCVLEQSS